jgi:hypothetical protein
MPLAPGPGEVRVAGIWGSGATSELRLKRGDHGIELRFEINHNRVGVIWRVARVHERRIAWKGVAKTTRPNGSFEVRQTLQDLPGADAVTATAWSPQASSAGQPPRSQTPRTPRCAAPIRRQ